MKTIGLLGGMSWESTLEYYRLINQFVNARLGALHSAELLLYSVNFEPVEQLQHEGRWEELTKIMVKRSEQLERAGAECIVICTNTMHCTAEDVEAAVNIPLIHIADATAKRALEKSVKSVGLLGTSFTMEQDFYRGRLERLHQLDVIVPNEKDRRTVHRVIYDELCKGVLRPESKAEYLSVIGELKTAGAQAVILGCTEIGLLVKQADVDIPVLDSTEIHAREVVDWALNER